MVFRIFCGVPWTCHLLVASNFCDILKEKNVLMHNHRGTIRRGVRYLIRSSNLQSQKHANSKKEMPIWVKYIVCHRIYAKYFRILGCFKNSRKLAKRRIWLKYMFPEYSQNLKKGLPTEFVNKTRLMQWLSLSHSRSNTALFLPRNSRNPKVCTIAYPGFPKLKILPVFFSEQIKKIELIYETNPSWREEFAGSL